uniref:Large ribosomal subunit protein uL23c n=1 Tax=Chondria tumulosa TaxID=2740715 RepID=A0A896SUF2_9FLOR|nr:ribosomal protein L23 [Chondria tumulosa]QSD57144.1 ribosomal protein L23 [Chondria tumulosa]
MISEKKIRNKRNIIEYPIITDKTTKNIENNIYYFKVKISSKKHEIKKAIENIFNVKVTKINTIIFSTKTKNIGKFKKQIKEYKKAIVKLQDSDKINLFENT